MADVEQNTQHFQRRLTELKRERAGWDPHWKDLHKFLSPRTSRFIGDDRQQAGSKKNDSIIDSTATFALGTLASGMMSGMTNPSRPWIQFRAQNPELNTRHSVKEWMDLARNRVLETFIKSNLYTTLPMVYEDLGCSGTNAFGVLEDDARVFRCMHHPIGSYYLGAGANGLIDSFYREFEMSVWQMVEKFGRDNCSTTVQSHYDSGRMDVYIQVVHVVEPNFKRNPNRLESRFKNWISVYYEPARNDGKELSRKGFDDNPIIASRWRVLGENVYGDSPAMVVLGDVKQLQTMQRDKLAVIKLNIRPPMGAPSALKGKRVSLLPSELTFYDTISGGNNVHPLIQPNLNLADLREDIMRTQERINRGFFTDLFLMFANIEHAGMTATEIAARQEEKLLALGPVYLRLNDEVFDPLVDRVFNIMMRAGLMPPPPPELEGEGIVVEYISVMAQTMKAVGITSIERVITFAGTVAQAFPEALDNINADEAIRSYADMAGTPAKLLFSPEARDEARNARARKQQMAEQLAAAQQGADVAQKLGNTPLGDNNALSQLVGRMSQAPQVPA